MRDHFFAVPEALIFAAKQAQDALVLWTEGDIPLASPLSLTALGGMNGDVALAALGLTLIYTDAQE